jgi:hypothetical protein
MGEMKRAYKIFVRKPERKRPLRSSRGILEDNIREIGWECVEWIHLAQYRD